MTIRPRCHQSVSFLLASTGQGTRKIVYSSVDNQRGWHRRWYCLAKEGIPMRMVLMSTTVVALLGAGGAAVAQSYLPLEDIYDDNKGTRFSHWSGVIAYPDRRYSLRYAVCNMNSKHDLYFRWDKPWFSTGWTNQLPIGKCGTHSFDSDAPVPDYDA